MPECVTNAYPPPLWARCNEEKTVFQTLRDHSMAVSRQMASSCQSIGLSAFGELLGWLHDAGKAEAAWQAYLRQPTPTETVCHAPGGVALAQELFHSRTSQSASLTLQMAVLTIRAHHGGLRDVLHPDGTPPELQQGVMSKQAMDAYFSQVVPESHLQDLFGRASEEVAHHYGQLCQLTDKSYSSETLVRTNGRQFLLGLTERFVYACLIDADRLDAATWDAQNGAGPPLSADQPPPANWGQQLSALETFLSGKPCVQPIDRLRRQISDTCGRYASIRPGIYRLYVPTGGGKTYASLRFGLAAAKQTQAKRLFLFEPLICLLKQNANAIREALTGRTDFRHDWQNDVVFEHHSNVVFEDEDGEASESLRRYQLRTERWAENGIITTSFVNFLNALFSGRSAAARRLSALSGAVLIFDEIQQIPPACLHLFNLAVTFLSRCCGCVVVLCTATQPALADCQYPLTVTDDLIKNVDSLFDQFRRNDIIDCLSPSRSTSELAEFVQQCFAKHGSCLAIVALHVKYKKFA